MQHHPDPTPAQRQRAQAWVVGTTIISTLGLLVWGIALAQGRIAFERPIFWVYLVLYILLVALRVRVTLVPPQRHARYWSRNVGVLYWIVTLPFLWIAGVLVLYWNGMPS